MGVLMLLPLLFVAQTTKKSRILFLFDASSSMTYNWNPEYNRFSVGASILLNIVDSVYAINNEVEFAVRAYGTIYPAQDKNCTDTRLEVPFNIQNANQIKTRLKNLTARGSSPIAYSLQQAAENELSESRQYDYSIILITDGGESCGGDICKTFNELLKKNIKVTPYIIGLDQNDQLKKMYECIGSYIQVTKPEDIQTAVKTIVDANRPLLEKPKQMNVKTVYSNTPVIEPIKDTRPPVLEKKDPFPRLSYTFFPAGKKSKGLMVPVFYLHQKGKKVTLKWDMDEPVPEVVKVTEVFPRLKLRLYTAPDKVSAAMKPKLMSLKLAKKVNLKFDWEEPKKEDPRVTDIFPRLKMKDVDFKKPEPKFAKVKTPKAFKPGKATLHFDIEPDRVTQVLPRLLMSDFVYKRPLTQIKIGKAKLSKRISPITATLHFEVEQRKKDMLSYIKAWDYPRQYTYAFRLPKMRAKSPKKDTARIAFKMEPIKRDTVRAAAPPQNNLDLEYTIETENSNETMVQIFFQGREGKKYLTAKPEIQFVDVATKQMTTSFKRTVSAGEPVPQKVNAGKYNVVVTGYNDLYANNVVIQQNKLNKVYIKVQDGTLCFAYIGNRNRPVEFNAIVNRRFATGATILQKCTDRLPYEPGTYYVEINTVPASKFSIDLTFGAVYEIQIAEPGQLQITNEAAAGKVILQCVLGDQYVAFYTLNVNGNLGQQLITLQPGFYKAIFPVDPRMPQAGTKTVDFRIFPNKTTDVELK